MKLAIPSAWLSTIAASDEMAATRPEWRDLNHWAQGEETTPILLAAVLDGQLTPVFLVEAAGGRHEEYELPNAYWRTQNAALAIYMPVDSHWYFDLPPEDRRRLAGSPICFRRHEWQPWLARWKTTSKAPSDTASTEDRAFCWLCQEMARRVGTGEERSRDAMAIAVRAEFPELGSRVARKLIARVPAALRAKPGAPRKANPGQE